MKSNLIAFIFIILIINAESISLERSIRQNKKRLRNRSHQLAKDTDANNKSFTEGFIKFVLGKSLSESIPNTYYKKIQDSCKQDWTNVVDNTKSTLQSIPTSATMTEFKNNFPISVEDYKKKHGETEAEKYDKKMKDWYKKKNGSKTNGEILENETDGYLDLFKGIKEANKNGISCALDADIFENNPLSQALKRVIFAQIGRVLGHIAGIFTLGIGNAATELTYQLVTLIRTVSALLSDVPQIVDAISNIKRSQSLDQSYQVLGFMVPKQMETIMKFYGARRRLIRRLQKLNNKRYKKMRKQKLSILNQ